MLLHGYAYTEWETEEAQNAMWCVAGLLLLPTLRVRVKENIIEEVKFQDSQNNSRVAIYIGGTVVVSLPLRVCL